MDAKLEKVLAWINSEYKGYFERVRPYTYFGDIASKNVMIHDGRFAGLVDLDSLAQGDPLEAIGRIKTSWYGTRHGSIYTDAVMDSLRLTDAQRKIVTMYALLNRAFWTLENGVQFNQNTSRTVDREREAQDKRIVNELLAELRGDGRPTVTSARSAGEPVVPTEQPTQAAAAVKPPRKPRQPAAQWEPPLIMKPPAGRAIRPEENF